MSTIINYLDKADASTTVALNFDGGSIMDSMSEVFSSRLLWVPIALVFLYFLFKADAKNRQRLLIILAVALTVTLCDQLTSHVMKPYFARLRPSHTPGVENLLHYVNGYRGGQYGFCSSHASNSFGVATFITLMTRRMRIGFAFFALSLCVAYSRIYLGVHYFGDVFVGTAIGIAIGFLVFYMLPKNCRQIWLSRRVAQKRCAGMERLTSKGSRLRLPVFLRSVFFRTSKRRYINM